MKKKLFACLLQEKQFHILSTDVVKMKSFRGSNLITISLSKISRLFCELPFQIAHFQARAF